VYDIKADVFYIRSISKLFLALDLSDYQNKKPHRVFLKRMLRWGKPFSVREAHQTGLSDLPVKWRCFANNCFHRNGMPGSRPLREMILGRSALKLGARGLGEEISPEDAAHICLYFYFGITSEWVRA
jgi:hypothetical protein